MRSCRTTGQLIVSHRRSHSAAGQLGAEAGQSGGPRPAAELPAAGGGAAGQARAALGRRAVRAALPRPALRPRAPRTLPTVPQNARTCLALATGSRSYSPFAALAPLQCPTCARRPVAFPSPISLERSKLIELNEKYSKLLSSPFHLWSRCPPIPPLCRAGDGLYSAPHLTCAHLMSVVSAGNPPIRFNLNSVPTHCVLSVDGGPCSSIPPQNMVPGFLGSFGCLAFRSCNQEVLRSCNAGGGRSGRVARRGEEVPAAAVHASNTKIIAYSRLCVTGGGRAVETLRTRSI